MGLAPFNMSALFNLQSFPFSVPDEVDPFWFNLTNE